MDTDEQNRYQLSSPFRLRVKSPEITSAPEGISGYTVSPDLSTVVYTTNQSAMESSIWLWDLESDQHQGHHGLLP